MNRIFSFTFGAAAVGVSLALTACDGSSSIKEPTNPDASTLVPPAGGGGVDGGGGDGGPKDCFDNPKTHFEIINACTTAQKITKNPTLSKLVDGGLPEL